jgi:hypothetical protein
MLSRSRYRKGTIPIDDTCWLVETVKDDKFVKVGVVGVFGKTVSREMDSHKSIKGYEPYDIAKKIASRKFKVNPVIVSEIRKPKGVEYV